MPVECETRVRALALTLVSHLYRHRFYVGYILYHDGDLIVMLAAKK